MAIGTAIMQTAGRLGGRVLAWPPRGRLPEIPVPLAPRLRDVDPKHDLDALALFGAA
jgi:hypothetical protein